MLDTALCCCCCCCFVVVVLEVVAVAAAAVVCSAEAGEALDVISATVGFVVNGLPPVLAALPSSSTSSSRRRVSHFCCCSFDGSCAFHANSFAILSFVTCNTYVF